MRRTHTHACAMYVCRALYTLHGEPAGVRKKLKNAAFAAAVSREDIATGIRELGVAEDEHFARCIAAVAGVSQTR